MASNMELIAFVRSQLDYEERVATDRGLSGGVIWSAVGIPSGRWKVVTAGRAVATDLRLWDAQHIVGWDPKRALDEIRAKRRILDLAVAEGWDENLTSAFRLSVRP